MRLSRQRIALAIVLLFLLMLCVFHTSSKKVTAGQTPQYQHASVVLLDKIHTQVHHDASQELGYFFALKYYEQQTQGTKNFFQMQCLASSYGMQVVEPFLYKSQIAFPLSLLAEGKKLLSFGDLIDMELWNKQTVELHGFREVSTWQEFLKKAPRDVILLCMKYRNPPRINIPVPGYDFRKGCPEGCFENLNASVSFLRRYGFKPVKQLCVNFADYAGSVTDKAFQDHIYGTNVEKKPVTVITNEFRGFFGLYRMQLLSQCGITRSTNISVMPSQGLVQDAQNYATSNYNHRPYVSILVRVEKIVLHSFLNLSSCAEEVVQILEKLEGEHGLKDYFLAMDVGKYGSSGAVLHNLQPQGEKFFWRIYKDHWTFKQWEESFARTSSANNSAYVANLQRTVAARGECLLMVGAGGFQAQARSLYERYHPNPASWCVYKVCAHKRE